MTENVAYPLVSIVLPTYNRAAYILETIESVRSQTYTNWELLVIDDCSLDNTIELVSGINDDRVKVYKTPHRVGITETRREGVLRAKGNLVAFIDSDDLWDVSKIQKQVETMNQYPDTGYCLTGGYNFKNKDEPLVYFYHQREGIKQGDLLLPFFNAEISALTPSLIFKKDCLSKIEFCSHVEFIMRLAAGFKGIILYEPLLFRRLHDANVSVVEWQKREKEGIALLKKYRKLVPAKIARNTLFKAYINSGESYLRHRKNLRAIPRFLGAWTQRPFSIIPAKKIAKSILYWLQGK